MINQMRERQLKILRAYVERRNRLWSQVRIANPTFTQLQVEARLEQFGA